MKFAPISLTITAVLLCLPSFAVEHTTPDVVIKKVEFAKLNDELTYPGRVTSIVNAAIQSPTDGIVREIFVTLGSKVKKNQPLFRIRKNEPGFSFAPLTVVASVAGVISDLKISLGSEVARGQALADVTDPEKLKICIDVAAQDLHLLHIGMPAEFFSSTLESSLNTSAETAAAKKSLAVKLSGVSPQVDSLTGTAAVEILLPSKTGLLEGSLGLVKLSVNERNGIQVAESAIRYKGAETFVSVVENGVAKNRTVQIASRSRGQAEISSGVTAGEDVVLRSSAFVTDGEKVNVAPAEK
jgi:multidrug efflux pump subunit AcrA (membrane-fusion protein)